MNFHYQMALIFALLIALSGCAALGDLNNLGALLPAPSEAADTVSERDAAYTSKDDVSAYLLLYGELPSNYITKSEARALGWPGGDLWAYAEGMSIGGDRFGNREGLLPEQTGRSYTECDINTDGADSRGAERLIFSNDGLYFYTSDHYASFTELTVDGGTVVWSR